MTRNNKIKALIIDDEEPARLLVKHYLGNFNNIDVCGECADGFTGLKSIRELQPDIVFLDIQMPRLTGFEMLELLEEKPAVIFTTAYDEFAIRAFDLNAIDYLLKPFPQERFNTAVEKALARLNEGTAGDDVKKILSGPRPEGSPFINRIVVRKGSSISFIPVTSIQYIESEDDYVMIWYSDGKALKQQTMKYYEENLPPVDFARIHRSCIVAISQIDHIEPYGKETYKAILKNGKRLPVSRSGYKILKDKVNF